MTIEKWLPLATARLVRSETPRLDAEVLLAEELKTDRAWLLAHPDHPLQGLTLQRVDLDLSRRMAGEPIAYIRGYAEFYGREFVVNKNVLIPRPESETMIELLTKYIAHLPNDHQVHIIDIGTGSGCLGLTASLESHSLGYGSITTTLSDISEEALAVAELNAKQHGVAVNIVSGNLLSKLLPIIRQDEAAIILANLPYVPIDFEVNLSVKFEPSIALFAGNDGLDLYGKLFLQLDSIDARPLLVFTESLTSQHAALKELAHQHGFGLHSSQDLILVFVRTNT